MEGPDSCLPGEEITIKLQAELEATSDERYDIGLFVATDGGNARTGACYRDWLPPPLADINNYDPGSPDPGDGGGPFYNAEISEDSGDVCGDLEQGVFTYRDVGEADTSNGGPVDITIVCQDSDGDQVADVGSCVSWDNTKSDGSENKPSCTSQDETKPNTKAKCKCESVPISGLKVPKTGTIEVKKALVPSTDSGRFNLQIDGATAGTGGNVGDGGTTGVVTVSAGFDPPGTGETHTVGETAGTSTNLGNYDTMISCADQEGDTASATDAGPLSLLVEPDDAWVCTITNQLRTGTLTVIKHVITDDGGTAVAGDFTISLNDTENTSFPGDETGTTFTFNAGYAYNVTETGPAGYAATFSGDCLGTIEAGGDKTCTITNDDVAPTLTLVKTVINDDGGTLTAADFPAFIDGNAVTWGVANTLVGDATYTASETEQYGYTASVWGGDCAEDGTVALSVGDNKTCTITNDDIQPKLIVIKHVVNNFDEPADPSDFTMFVDGNNASPASFPGDEDGTTVMLDAAPYYEVTEIGVDGYEASFSADCSGSIAVGEEKICTVTNTRVLHPGTIGFWKNWDNHYDLDDFQRLIDHLKSNNPKVYNEDEINGTEDDLTSDIVDAIFEFGKKTPRDQMILAQLTAVKFNLAVTELAGPDIVQKNDDICLDTVVDVSGIRGARRFFGTPTPKVSEVVDAVEAKWVGQLRMDRKSWKFRLSKAEQNIVIKTLTGINEGDIIIEAGCDQS